MLNPQTALKEFHGTFGLNYNDEKAELPDAEERELRRSLMKEEYSEYVEAEQNDDLENIAKELSDIVYIAYGTAVSYGISLDKIFEEVHRSNMSKVNPDGTITRRADGKILKPDTYTAPDLTKFL